MINKFSWVLIALTLAACNKSPFERTRDASGGGALGKFGSGNFVVFFDELRTGGGAFLFPGGENQTLSFDETSNTVSRRSIRYSWNGGDVTDAGALQHNFAGFDLMHTPLLATYATTPGRDLRAAGYTKVTFFARGSLSTRTVIEVEVAEPFSPPPCLVLSTDGATDIPPINPPCGNKAQLTGSWQPYSIAVPNGALANVKDFFKATFNFDPPFVGDLTPGQGGTVFFDDIEYQP